MPREIVAVPAFGDAFAPSSICAPHGLPATIQIGQSVRQGSHLDD